MECQNHLKQMTLASLNHESAHGFLPAGGWGSNWIGDPLYGVDWRQPGGWIFNLLPYVEGQGIYDLQLDKTGPEKTEAIKQMTARALPTFQCPSRRAPQPLTSGFAQSDYAGNGGEAYVGFNGTGPDNMLGPADYQAGTVNPGRAGWSIVAAGSTGIFYGASQTKLSDILDGTSQTYFAAEKFLDPDDYNTGLNLGDDQNMYTGCQDDIVRWVGNGTDLTYTPREDDADTAHYYHFGSAHSGGFNASMCDGSVHSISYSIDLETHRQLGNRKDGRVIDKKVL